MNARLIKETRDLLPIFGGTLLADCRCPILFGPRAISDIFALG